MWPIRFLDVMVGDIDTFDAVLELCRDRDRRIILAVFLAQRRPLTLNDLVESIVNHDRRTSMTDVPSDDRSRIQISLVHKHLPKLEERGVVEYDSPRRLVEPTATFDEWQPLLSAIIDADPTLEVPVEL